MKSLNQYITEFVNINNISIYKYHPKTKDELIENIKTELKNGNTDLNYIDVSSITEMNLLFDQEDGIILTKEQQETLDVSQWDVSKVEDMYSMFYNCEQFNCDLSNWNVSNVKDMNHMFYYCKNFNSDLSNWNVSNVEDMSCMFYSCRRFKSDLSKWNVNNVKNMGSMFFISGLDDDNNKPSWYKK